MKTVLNTHFYQKFNNAKKSLLPALCVGLTYCLLLICEKKRPLREMKEGRTFHEMRNFSIAASSALTVILFENPVIKKVMKFSESKKTGILPLLKLSSQAEIFLAVILLDYTLYIWHVLNHKIKFLWRFHEVHHQDLDLTASTGVRFHFFEIFLSVFWRVLQVLAIGVKAPALQIWQSFTLLEILFHHSNLNLPKKWEQLINFLLVTPRMHTIHHSTKWEEMNSNWSSGLTVWDFLHRTLNLEVEAESVSVGAPRREDMKLSLKAFLTQPFGYQKE